MAGHVPSPVPGENVGAVSEQAALCLARGGPCGTAVRLQTATGLSGGAKGAPSAQRCLPEAGLAAGLAGGGQAGAGFAEIRRSRLEASGAPTGRFA